MPLIKNIGLDVFFSDPLVYFSISLITFIILGFVEIVVMTIAGSRCLHFLDFEIEAPEIFTAVTNWMSLKEIPLSVIMLLSLLGFGSSGLMMQALYFNQAAEFMPILVVIALSVFSTVFFLKATSKLLSPIFRVETDAVSESALIGRIATINDLAIKPGLPISATVVDHHQKVHHIFLEAENRVDTFSNGDLVRLLGRRGFLFTAELKI